MFLRWVFSFVAHGRGARLITEQAVPGPTPATHDGDEPRSPEGPRKEDRLILWLAIVVGAVAVIPQVVSGEEWSAQPTVGLILALVALALLVLDR